MEHEMALVDQRLVNYEPAETLEHACALCEYYCPAVMGCHRVAGQIRPDYVCSLFEPAVLAEEPEGQDVEDSMMDDSMLEGGYAIAKADDAQQIVFGWANVAITKTGEQTVDHHRDVIDADELETAAYDFVLHSRASGEDHAGEVDAQCVESIVFTVEKARAMGIPDGVLPEAGWWVGFHIPDRDAYLRARDSKAMFSIEGTAVREPVAVEKAAIPSHRTPTTTDDWDGAAHEGRARSGENAAYYGRIYAWRDATMDPTVKAAYAFIHHHVDDDGTPGPANVKALQSAIGILNGGRGVDVGNQPWGEDREAIYRHLAAHLRDAGLAAPPLT